MANALRNKQFSSAWSSKKCQEIGQKEHEPISREESPKTVKASQGHFVLQVSLSSPRIFHAK